MAVTIYYENDCKPEVIQGKKIAIIGYPTRPSPRSTRSTSRIT